MLIGRLKPATYESREEMSLTRKFLKPVQDSARVFHPLHFAKTLWRMRPLTLAVVVLLISAPWFFLVDLRTEGDFTRLFFVDEHIGRATTAFESHRGGLWYYPLAILVGFLPWAVFWAPVAMGLKKRSKTGLGIATVFCLCWVGVQVVLFSLAQTKLPSYVTPCYGALAILTADCLYRWSVNRCESVSDSLMFAAEAGLVVAGAAIAIGLGFASYSILGGATWLMFIGFIPVLAGLVGCWQVRKKMRHSMVATNVVAAVLLAVTVFGFGTKAVSNLQTNREILETIAAAETSVNVATFGCLESSWVFYSEQPLFELVAKKPAEMKSATAELLAKAKDWKPKNRLTPEQFCTGFPQRHVHHYERKS